MPIVGLTDRQASFPKIGTIRKGAPKGPNTPGKDLTHFRFTSEDPEVMDRWIKAFGETPRRLTVFLPFASTDDNFQTWMEHWAAGGLVHRCDGMNTVLIQTENGYSQVPQPCPGQCKQVGRLHVIIPELGRLAYVTVLTTSIHDIMELSRNLKAYESIGRGSLVGIPFILSRVPQQISTPAGPGKPRVRREKWLLHLEAASQYVAPALMAMQTAALNAVNVLEGDYSHVHPLLASGEDDQDDQDWVGNSLDQEIVALAEELGGVVSAADDEIPQLLMTLRQTGQTKTAQAPTNQQLTAVRAGFSKLGLKGRKEKVQLLQAVFGIDSTSELTQGMAGALLDWFQADPQNGYAIPDHVKDQALEILNYQQA